ncbi:hypothetical protein [Micromonospora trifolii]|uniref:hypothetical protein n=1 Tax=Micromonospora trifolii TaxID=2911208 RepID=UPI003CFB570B
MSQSTGGECARTLAATVGPLWAAGPAKKDDETVRRLWPGEFEPALTEAQAQMSWGCVG